MEYLKAWLWKEKKLAEKGKKHSEDEITLMKYVEQMLTALQGLLDTKLVRRTKAGNFELAELADYQTQVRILKDENKILREVAEFYAHDEMFKETFKNHPNFGETARQALKEIENENKSN